MVISRTVLMWAYQYFLEQTNSGTSYESALEKTQERYGLSESQVKRLIGIYENQEKVDVY